MKRAPKNFYGQTLQLFCNGVSDEEKNAFNLTRGADVAILFSSSLVLLQNKLERSSGVGFYKLV